MEEEEALVEEIPLEELKTIVKSILVSKKRGLVTCTDFEQEEHQNVGNDVELRFPSPGEVLGAERPLVLPNGLKLTFGQIIALAGDFYGVPDYPIIDPTKEHEEDASGRRERFIAAYETLAFVDCKNIKKELEKILKIMVKERVAVEAVLEQNSNDNGRLQTPKDVYDSFGNTLVEQWDEITGGKWIFGVPIRFGRIMKLAENNYDHFLPFAQDAYLVGHQLALEKAKMASKVEDEDIKISILEEAYSIDAFACHFLTDSFSSGHLRTPRYELAKATLPKKLGSLLSKFMHDEDNNYGLRVINRRGDKWIAYGDGMFFNEESEKNRAIAMEAVQTSVDQVYQAFLNPGEATDLNEVTDYIPFVDANEKNNTAMFQVKDGRLLRRADLSNLRDPKTKSSWNGVMTVLKAQLNKPYSSIYEI